MGVLLVFAAGYVMGSRSSGESLDEVVDAFQAIRESEEFHDLVKALRTHTAHSLRGLATVLENGRERQNDGQQSPPADLLERVRLIVGWR